MLPFLSLFILLQQNN